MIRKVLRFTTTDNKLFTDYKDALDHQEDLLGEALDSLIPYDSNGRITRSDRHDVLMQMINPNNRETLTNKITYLYNMLSTNHFVEDDDE